MQNEFVQMPAPASPAAPAGSISSSALMLCRKLGVAAPDGSPARGRMDIADVLSRSATRPGPSVPLPRARKRYTWNTSRRRRRRVVQHADCSGVLDPSPPPEMLAVGSHRREIRRQSPRWAITCSGRMASCGCRTRRNSGAHVHPRLTMKGTSWLLIPVEIANLSSVAFSNLGGIIDSGLPRGEIEERRGSENPCAPVRRCRNAANGPHRLGDWEAGKVAGDRLPERAQPATPGCSGALTTISAASIAPMESLDPIRRYSDCASARIPQLVAADAPTALSRWAPSFGVSGRGGGARAAPGLTVGGRRADIGTGAAEACQ